MASLLGGYDCLLLDLDGVVYLGGRAVVQSVESINRAQAAGVRVGYVTNNSSRRPESVAQQLADFGLTLSPDDVVGSARAAVKMLIPRIESGASVLVVGGEGLRHEVEAAGFVAVDSAEHQPVAVVQGYSPDVGWRNLAEAAFAIQAGAIWIATNQDWTLPLERGLAPGNGTLVSAVHTAVGILPDFAGKPARPIFDEALARFSCSRPLFIGDRLDTDILGAKAAGIASAVVMTGVATRKDLLAAKAAERPDFILSDLSDLHKVYPKSKSTKYGVRVGQSQVEILGSKVVLVTGNPESIDTLRAATEVIWKSDTPIFALEVEPELYGGS